MAETTVRTKTKLGWTKSGMESSSDAEDAVIPGVNSGGPGNMRPRLKPRRRQLAPGANKDGQSGGGRAKVKDNHSHMSAGDAPSSSAIGVQDLSQSLDERRLRSNSGVAVKQGQVTLKDLCVEDKRRIANLIRELAKVGEERERARQELDEERQSYEQQILKLVEQQEHILNERHEVEKHLQECRQLLAQSQPHHFPLPSSHSQPHLSPSPAPPPPPLLPPPPLPSSSSSAAPTFPFSASKCGPSIPPALACGWTIGGEEGFDPHTCIGSSPRNGVYPSPAHLGFLTSHLHPTRGDPALPLQPWPSQQDQQQHRQLQQQQQRQQLQQQQQQQQYQHLLQQKLQQQQQQQQYQQRQQDQHQHQHRPGETVPAVDFFANVLRHSQPLDIFSSSKEVVPLVPLPPHPTTPPPLPPAAPHLITPPHHHVSATTSKDAVIKRFFASQPAMSHFDDDDNCNNNGDDLVSPRLRVESHAPAACVPSKSNPRGQRQKNRRKGKGSAFPRPVMSSTQKSGEFKDCLSQDSHLQEFLPLPPDESDTHSFGGRGGEGDGSAGKGKERGGRGGWLLLAGGVVSAAQGSKDGQPPLLAHSPPGDGGDVESQAFRRLSHAQRKEQLLEQRARLMEEQQRLRHILTEQEVMLREKQRALVARSQQQGQGQCQGRRHSDSDPEEKGNKSCGLGSGFEEDPLGLVPQRVAIDRALERQRAIIDSLELGAQQRNTATTIKSTNPTTTTTKTTAAKSAAATTEATDTTTAATKTTDTTTAPRDRWGAKVAAVQRRGGEDREKEGGGGETFVIQSGSHRLSDVVCRLDYSLHSDTEELAENENGERASAAIDEVKEEEEGKGEKQEKGPSLVHRNDASTSISYRTLPRSSERGNRLTEEGRDKYHHTLPHSISPHTPGEKTLSVLEIINTLHSPPLKPALMQEFAPSSQQRRGLSPLRRWRGCKADNDDDSDDDDEEENKDDDMDDNDEIVVMDSSDEDEDENIDSEYKDGVPDNEDLEESQILEDIFFLK